MQRLIAGALTMSLALCLGCGSEDDDTQDGDTQSEAVAKYESSYRKYTEAICGCESAQNGASVAVCVEARLAESGVSECQRKALSHPDAAHTLDCETEATLIEVGCMKEAACDSALEIECMYDHEENTLGCELPDSVRDVMDACAPEPFHCVGGGSVDIDAVCDLVEDCADGSDEVPC